MRIISQCGRFDIPYEMAVVYVECESIIAKVGDERYVMGNYSTEEKAFKVMEMLIEKHLKYMEIEGYVIPTGQGILQPNFWVLPKIFRFPQDDEIEV